MNEQKLCSIFAETLSISLEQVTDDLQYNSIEKWDSIAHMALVAAVESAFNIMMDADDVIDFSSVAKAKEILRKHGIDI